MATKKTAAKKPTSLVKWDEKFAQYARAGKEQIQSIGGTGLAVSFGRGVIKVGDKEVKTGKVNVVVLGYCALNAFYKKAWDPNEKTPPDCYAFSLAANDPEMAPHPSVARKESAKCADCPQNVFGTASVGAGKACANKIRLGMLTEDSLEDAESVQTAELGVGHVSPTNLKRWKKYVDDVESEYGRPVWAVVTEITSENDPKTQIKVSFKVVDKIEDDDILSALERRVLKVQDALQTPYAAASEKAPAKKAATGVGKGGKFAAKKASAR
jgi:hypothetical protein